MHSYQDPEGSYDEKRIVTSISDTGSGAVATRGYVKRNYKFLGKGIMDGDRAKFVPFNTTFDDECGEGNANSVAGMVGDDVVDGELIVQYAGNDVAFTVPSPPGEPYKLCYYFTEIRTYVVFSSVVLDVRDVASMTIDSGDPESVVAGIEKNITFRGPGVTLDGDSFKFVPFSVTTDDGCVHTDGTSMSGQGVVNNIGSTPIVSNITNYSRYEDGMYSTELALHDMSPQDSKPYKLCYKFATEEYKLYPDFTVLVKDLSDLTSNVGDGDIAVIDYQKTFMFDGTGTGANDTFFFVNFDRSDPLRCNDPGDKAVVSSVRRGNDTYEGTPFSLVNGEANLTFWERTDPNRPHQLCYRFGPLEPFKFYETQTITVKEVTNISASSGRGNVAVLNVSKTFSMAGTGIGVGDRVKWIQGTALEDRQCNMGQMSATRNAFDEITSAYISNETGFHVS